MSKKRRNRKPSVFETLFWGAIFLVFILWFAYNRTTQIDKYLTSSSWPERRSETIKVEHCYVPHYPDLEIPARFTDGRDSRICRYTGHTLSYNRRWRLPNWVAYELLESELKSVVDRKDNFRPDKSPDLQPQAGVADYRHSGYDRGHMAPAGDMLWNADAMSETFYFTNICPQTPALNRGDWMQLENRVRDWAYRDSAILIVCGPLVSPRDGTIGPDRVVVPSAFYKVVLSPYQCDPQGIGFIFENDTREWHRPLTKYAVTIDSVEALTGIDFFPGLPDEIENLVESRYDAEYWDI
ncbi:MAG: DNA/RNA non-specific endonuclease [Porphyromonadaceae bacterium]|nr:DNA/RNA non-specific endonuclease [Porphyromonadaceae bacterium]